MRREKLDRLRKLPADQECTFKPKLVARSKQTEGLTKSISQKEAPDRFTLGDMNGPIKEVDESGVFSAQGISVFDRLTSLANEMPARRKGREKAKLASERVDEKTGQKLFKPKTGRPVESRSKEVKEEGGIANYLYKKHQQKE